MKKNREVRTSLPNPAERVVEICWRCSGTGRVFVSMSPLKFRICPMCNGRRGKVERTT